MREEPEVREPVLDALEPAGPPDELRDRVLARAGEALDHAAGPDAWTRIYRSRPLRAAWAASVLALLAAILLVPRGAKVPARERLTAESARRIPELRDVVAVPRVDEALVSIDRLAYGRPAAPSAGPARKEKSS